MELIYESVEECIQAELEIRSMERLQAQKRKMNPEAEFTDLSLDLFKRICSFKEQDWKIYSACCESEKECFDIEHDVECECCVDEPSFLPREYFYGTDRLDYKLYLAMRTAQKKVLNVTRTNFIPPC